MIRRPSSFALAGIFSLAVSASCSDGSSAADGSGADASAAGASAAGGIGGGQNFGGVGGGDGGASGSGGSGGAAGSGASTAAGGNAGSAGSNASGGASGSAGAGASGATGGAAGASGSAGGGASGASGASGSAGGGASGSGGAGDAGGADSGVCVVRFDDAVLERRVRQALGGPSPDAGPDAGQSSDPIPCANMAALTVLDVSNPEGQSGAPSSLTGLEHAVNLQSLTANQTDVSSLSPLAGLTQLRDVVIRNTEVRSVSALKDHPTLRTLDMSRGSDAVTDGLGDLTQLGDPPQLEVLRIGYSGVIDLMPLAQLADTLTTLDIGGLLRAPDLEFIATTLPNLTSLELYRSKLRNADVSELESMTSLSFLDISLNDVSDIAPLAANSGFGSGDTIDVRLACLNLTQPDTQASKQIAFLRARGVTVLTDPQNIC